jgi:putative DNA primase/helicase
LPNDNNNNEFNKAADHIRYIIGANVIPANTRAKKPNFNYITTWEEWQDKPIPEWQHEEWKAQGAFNNGLAVVLGRLFHKNTNLFLNGIDGDNAKAIQEICTRNGNKTITVQELAQWTYLEQHDDRPDKMHLLVYSEGRPFVSKSSDQAKLADKLKANEVPAIEVKNIGAIFYVAPGIHRDKETLIERPIKIIGTNIPVLSNSFEQDVDNILSKYGIPYLNGADSSNNSAKIPIDELFKEDFRIYEGHNRSEALLRVMESLIARNSSILTPDEIKDMARRWNNKHCIPPLDDKKFEMQWKCANKFCCSNNNNDNNGAQNNNNNNNNNKKSKQAVLFITDKLLANYTFKTLKDTEEIYYYNPARGIYTPGGESLIKSEVEKEMPEISTNQVNEILNHIIRRTLIDRSEFDADIEWLTLKNCMVNLLTLETRPHSPEYMTTIQIPIPYDISNNNDNTAEEESAISQFFELVVDPISHPCPGIMNFMYEVVSSAEDVQTILDFIAYCFWRGFPFHILLFFNGTGRNGKGVMLTVIKRVLGFQNISGESLHRILENRFAVAELYGKLANIDADLSTDALRNTGTLKKLTGGDPIPAERKFQRPFKFVNYAKLIFSANEIPHTPDETDAFFARPIIINFPNQFIMGANADPYLADKITTDKELSGLLQIVLQRLPRVLKHGVFTASSSIAENYDKYILSSNPIRAFTEKCVRLDNNYQPSKEEVYSAYRSFCMANKITIESDQAFSRKMKKLEGFKDERRRDRKTGDLIYYWQSIKIVDWKATEKGQETLT